MSNEKPTLVVLTPDQIVRNEENPRLHFPRTQMDELAKSIDEVGILVPISVYPGPEPDSGTYVLIDGERRWLCAQRLGRDVPAIVLPPPDSVQNLLTMFNIHMVREQWDDMPTAWALKKFMERTGETDTARLAQMAGIRREQVNRYKLVLRLPEEYQQLIDADEIPLNFFVELQRNVIEPLRCCPPGSMNTWRHS